MKRDLGNLLSDSAQRNDDEQLARSKKRREMSEFRAARLEQSKMAEVAQLESHLKQWRKEDVLSASTFDIVAPHAIPVGINHLESKS